MKYHEAKNPAALAPILAVGDVAQLLALDPPVSRLLAHDYGLQALADRICPVLRADGKASIFALQDYVAGDQTDAIERKLRLSGLALSSPARFTLPSALLLALSRGAIDFTGSKTIERTPTVLAKMFADMVFWGVKNGATDLHINLFLDAPLSEVRFTIAGFYVAPECFRNLPTALLHDVLAVVWMDIQGGNGAVFDLTREQQGSLAKTIEGKQYILRWASLAAERGPSVCLRILAREASQMPDLGALGYRAEHLDTFQRILRSEGGAIIFAGTVGSGKSTTLASLICSLPDYRKVITIEEPVEYRIAHAVQNSIGRDLADQAHEQYAAKLRTIKRSAMTDVLLGEIRDRASARAFMDLAGAGINIYTTVHAPGARAIVDRLASDFIAVPRDFLQATGTLKLLVYQVLLPKLCDQCAIDPCAPGAASRLGAEDWASWQALRHYLEQLWPVVLAGVRLRNRAGCPACQRLDLPQLNGYQGRTLAAELLEPGFAASEPEEAYTLDGASALAHAMNKVALGQIDPRDIEPRFSAFETMLRRKRHYRPDKSCPVAKAVPGRITALQGVA